MQGNHYKAVTSLQPVVWGGRARPRPPHFWARIRLGDRVLRGSGLNGPTSFERTRSPNVVSSERHLGGPRCWREDPPRCWREDPPLAGRQRNLSLLASGPLADRQRDPLSVVASGSPSRCSPARSPLSWVQTPRATRGEGRVLPQGDSGGVFLAGHHPLEGLALGGIRASHSAGSGPGLQTACRHSRPSGSQTISTGCSLVGPLRHRLRPLLAASPAGHPGSSSAGPLSLPVARSWIEFAEVARLSPLAAVSGTSLSTDSQTLWGRSREPPPPPSHLACAPPPPG